MRIDTTSLDPAQSGAGERPATLHRSWLREMEKAQLALLVELPGQPAADRDGAERPRDDALSRHGDEQNVHSQNLRPVWWQQASVGPGAAEPVTVAKTEVAVAEAAVAPEAPIAAEPMTPLAKTATLEAPAAPVASREAGFVAAEPVATAQSTPTPAPQSVVAARESAPDAVARRVDEEAPAVAEAFVPELPFERPESDPAATAWNPQAGVGARRGAAEMLPAGVAATTATVSNIQTVNQIEAPRSAASASAKSAERGESRGSAAPAKPERSARPQWQRQWMHVTDGGDALRVWVRDAALDRHAAQRLAYRLVAELGGGLRPVEVSINGRSHGSRDRDDEGRGADGAPSADRERPADASHSVKVR